MSLKRKVAVPVGSEAIPDNPRASEVGCQMQRSQGFPCQLAGPSPSRFTALGSYRGDMNTNLAKGRESEPTVGWSRAAQDAAESPTVASHENVATQPFLKRRIGYGTTGALLITV